MPFAVAAARTPLTLATGLLQMPLLSLLSVDVDPGEQVLRSIEFALFARGRTDVLPWVERSDVPTRVCC